MDRAEGAGLTVAVLGHVALFGILSVGFLATPNPLKLKPVPIEVALVDQVALESTSPNPTSEAPAPKLAPVEAPIEPDSAPPEPAPNPQPIAKPQPAPPKQTSRTMPSLQYMPSFQLPSFSGRQSFSPIDLMQAERSVV